MYRLEIKNLVYYILYCAQNVWALFLCTRASKGKFRFFSFKGILPVCFLIAGIVNTLFLLHIVSKVVVIFGLYFALMGFILFLVRKNTKVFYAMIPFAVIFVIAFGFIVPVSIPVTNDIVAKTPNCAYTLKSTSEDMAVFCQELMKQYHNHDGAVKELFSAVVMIDTEDRKSVV